MEGTSSTPASPNDVGVQVARFFKVVDARVGGEAKRYSNVRKRPVSLTVMMPGSGGTRNEKHKRI